MSILKNPKAISWILGITVVVVSAAIIFQHLGTGSIWRDEAFSIELAKTHFHTLFHVTLTVEGNMLLYYLIMHFWLGLLSLLHISWSAFAVRIPNALAYVGASLVLWRLADYLLGRAGGLLAVVIWWAFPWAVTYGQQARAFSFFFLFTALSFYALVRLIDSDGAHARAWAVLYGVATLLNVYSFLDAVFYSIVQVLWMTWVWRRGTVDARRYGIYWLALIGAAVLSLPLVPTILHGGQVGWVPLQSLHAIVRYPTTWLEKPRHSLVTVFVVLGVIIGIIAAFIPRKPRKDSSDHPTNLGRAVGIGLVWAVVPLIVEYLVSHYLHFHILDPVYALPTTLGIALAASSGWASIRVGPAPWVLLVLGWVLVTPQYHRGQGVSLENWRPPVLDWAHQVKPSQRIVAIDNIGGVQYTLQYYIDAYHLPIVIRPYPGDFNWTIYPELGKKGAWFAEAASVSKLQQAGLLKPGQQVWFALNGATVSLVQPLESWLSTHAVLKEKIHQAKWPVSFQLWQVK